LRQPIFRLAQFKSAGQLSRQGAWQPRFWSGEVQTPHSREGGDIRKASQQTDHISFSLKQIQSIIKSKGVQDV